MPVIKFPGSQEGQKVRREVLAIVSGYLARNRSFAKVHISLHGSGINHIIFKDNTLTGEQKEEIRHLLRRFL